MLIGVFSDAHGHEAGYVLAREELRARGSEKLLFLGDAVGYIPDPAVVRHLLADDIPWVKGNHEVKILTADVSDEHEPQYRHVEVREQLTADEIKKIEALPERIEKNLDGRDCLFVHGSPNDDTNGYVYPDTDLSAFLNMEFDIAFMGHTHHPFVRREGGKIFVNVGSCGLPRDDTRMGCAALYDTRNHKAELVHFDLSEASQSVLNRFDLAAPVRQALEKTLRHET